MRLHKEGWSDSADEGDPQMPLGAGDGDWSDDDEDAPRRRPPGAEAADSLVEALSEGELTREDALAQIAQVIPADTTSRRFQRTPAEVERCAGLALDDALREGAKAVTNERAPALAEMVIYTDFTYDQALARLIEFIQKYTQYIVSPLGPDWTRNYASEGLKKELEGRGVTVREEEGGLEA